MIKIAICEDEPAMLEIMESHVRTEFTNKNIDFTLNTYMNGEQLIKDNEELKFNVLFLDICMPSVSGFDIAKHFRDENNRVYIIFVTANSEYVYSSLNYQPFNFVRK